MVVEGNNGPVPIVYGHKQSTVVPASVTGEVNHDLTNMDVAMKLHYLRGVYYFKKSEIIDSLTVLSMKEPMFPWLDMYYQISGRIRQPEEAGNRLFVKCNDCGVRIIEAKCKVTLDEWLSDKELLSRCKHLVPSKALGPQLYFSPLTYVQYTPKIMDPSPSNNPGILTQSLMLVYITSNDASTVELAKKVMHKLNQTTTFFGLAIGFSWSHVMGDPHSAVNCFNKWSQLLQDMKTLRGKPNPLSKLESNNISAADKAPADVVPSSVKEALESVGDTWVLPNSSQMATYSFQIKDHKLKQLQSREGLQVGEFELISALLWHTIAKVKAGKEVNTITLLKNNLSSSNTSLANEQSISSVKIDSSPSKLDISELAMAISKDAKNETQMVEAFVQGENGYKDLVVYGANLTFIDMLDLDLYGFTLKGQKPVNVEYAIDGVGEEGSVLVMQGNENDAKLVVLVLPENELHKVKEVLPMSVL